MKNSMEIKQPAYTVLQISKEDTVKPVFNGHSKIVKIKILMTNGSLMKIKSIAECSPWSTLQYFWPALSNKGFGLENQFLVIFLSGLLRQVLLYFYSPQDKGNP